MLDPSGTSTVFFLLILVKRVPRCFLRANRFRFFFPSTSNIIDFSLLFVFLGFRLIVCSVLALISNLNLSSACCRNSYDKRQNWQCPANISSDFPTSSFFFFFSSLILNVLLSQSFKKKISETLSSVLLRNYWNSLKSSVPEKPCTVIYLESK